MVLEEPADSSRWMYVPLSYPRFLAARQGKTSVRDLFAQPEDERLLAVTFSRQQEEEPAVEPVLAEEVPADWLPGADYFLKVPDSLPSVAWGDFEQQDVAARARQTEAWLRQQTSMGPPMEGSG
jgi:hypothetical protein